MKIKTLTLSIILFGAAIYSGAFPEKYHVLIPVILGSMCILSIAALATDRKEK